MGILCGPPTEVLLEILTAIYMKVARMPALIWEQPLNICVCHVHSDWLFGESKLQSINFICALAFELWEERQFKQSKGSLSPSSVSIPS